MTAAAILALSCAAALSAPASAADVPDFLKSPYKNCKPGDAHAEDPRCRAWALVYPWANRPSWSEIEPYANDPSGGMASSLYAQTEITENGYFLVSLRLDQSQWALAAADVCVMEGETAFKIGEEPLVRASAEECVEDGGSVSKETIWNRVRAIPDVFTKNFIVASAADFDLMKTELQKIIADHHIKMSPSPYSRHEDWRPRALANR